jgi:hypothetical protein
MKNLNKILTLGAGAILILSSCSTSYNAMRGGESDDLYFMASDAQIATEFAVSNNNPQNFQSLNNIEAAQFEQENFSARNVNPEYLAKYQSQSNVGDTGGAYFDDSDGQQEGNVNVYNNFYGSGAGLPGQGFNNSRVNFNLGFGFGAPMWGMGWGMPMMGMGWGMPMMGMWDPFWGMPMMGWGMRPGFGMGMGWNSMWGWNMGMGMGMGWGMGGMWGNPWMNPWMGGGMGMWGMRPGWGWGAPGIGWGGESGRQVVRGARPGRGSSSAVGGNRPGTNYPATTRAARRDAVNSDRSVGSTSRATGRDFSRSQNDYYNSSRTNSRVANSAATGNRNVGSAAATRPSSRTGIDNARPNYNSRTGTGTTRGSSYGNTNRGTTSPSFNNRSTQGGSRGNASPSYNRGNTNMNRTAPSRNMSSPSRNTMSAPSRSSSPSMSSPSRGGSSMGGGSMGGSRGGGMSSGGSRGGRGN